MRTKRFEISTRLAFGSLVALIFLSAFFASLPIGRAQAATNSIGLVSSGLVSSDSLVTGSTSSWAFGGDAASQPGAKYTYSEDSQGLHIGVRPATSGTWSGYYAVSRNTSATLFHAVVTLAYPSIPDNGFNTGMYVQTADSNFIDYVDCVAESIPQGYYWLVEQAYGVIIGSQVINTLYQSPLSSGPLKQDCTIITNGNNYLRVYLGGSLVVDRNNLTLNMPSPQRVYLEPQSSTSSSLLTGTYTDYYATTGEGVRVTNGPAGGTAKILDASSNVLASAPIAANGSATLPVGKYSLPLSATIEVFDPSNSLVASTPSQVTIWGGDVYSISSSPTTSSTTTTTSSTSVITLTNDQSTSGTVSTLPYQITIPNFNAGTGTNRLLLVGVSANDANVASISFGGVPLAQVAASFWNNDAEFWYMVNPSGTANLVVTMKGATSAVVGAYAFTGVDQTNPIPTVATNHNMLGSSPSISITTKFSGSWVIDLPSIYGGSTLGSPSCTQHWDADVPGAITGASSSAYAQSPRQVTCAWTASPTDLWDNVAVEVRAST